MELPDLHHPDADQERNPEERFATAGAMLDALNPTRTARYDDLTCGAK